jgi:hypothetical protein
MIHALSIAAGFAFGLLAGQAIIDAAEYIHHHRKDNR